MARFSFTIELPNRKKQFWQKEISDSLYPASPSKRKSHLTFPNPFREEDSLKRAQLPISLALRRRREGLGHRRDPSGAPSATSGAGQRCFASRGQAALRKRLSRPSPAHRAAPGRSLPLCARRGGGAGSRFPASLTAPRLRPVSALRPSRLRPSQSADRKGPRAANQHSAHWDAPAFYLRALSQSQGALLASGLYALLGNRAFGSYSCYYWSLSLL